MLFPWPASTASTSVSLVIASSRELAAALELATVQVGRLLAESTCAPLLTIPRQPLLNFGQR